MEINPKDLSPREATQALEKHLTKMTSTELGRRKFLLFVPVLMAACAAKEKTRFREGDNTGQVAELTPEEERRLTAEVLPELQKQYPRYENAEAQKYIERLGQRIIAANNLEGKPYQYQFSLVRAPYVNAFALPAGTVLVTVPLLELAETEAELAGVVGHEIGHIQARHAAERMAQAKRERKKSWLYGAGGGIIGGALGFGLGKLLCPPKDDACLAQATALGAAAGAGGGLLIQKFAFMANSREDEMEADRIGFRTSVKAGYSKDYVGRFYSKLQKMEEERKRNNTPILSSVADALSTHPPSRERVLQMNQLVAEATQTGGEINTPDFDRMRSLARDFVKTLPKK